MCQSEYDQEMAPLRINVDKNESCGRSDLPHVSGMGSVCIDAQPLGTHKKFPGHRTLPSTPTSFNKALNKNRTKVDTKLKYSGSQRVPNKWLPNKMIQQCNGPQTGLGPWHVYLYRVFKNRMLVRWPERNAGELDIVYRSIDFESMSSAIKVTMAIRFFAHDILGSMHHEILHKLFMFNSGVDSA